MPKSQLSRKATFDPGEMDVLVSRFDWSRTPLGSIDAWPPALRITVRNLLANQFPQLLWWGPDYLSIYNDACRPMLGSKHPRCLGQPARECWSEIWTNLKPRIDTPFNGGTATWIEDLELEIPRHGFTEEAHFTAACSPVADDASPGGIGGVLATLHETTSNVLGERRIAILRDLAMRAAEPKTAEEACVAAAATLARHAKEIPFALLYVVGPDASNREDRHARLAAWCGFSEDALPPRSPVSLDQDDPGGWPLAAARRSGRLQVVENLPSILGTIPRGPWSDPPRRAIVAPIRVSGFLVAGLSSRLNFDDAYRNFLELAASQIATAVPNALDEEVRSGAAASRPRILAADANAEMREHLTGVLRGTYDVEALGNRDAARRRTPDRVLADTAMPPFEDPSLHLPRSRRALPGAMEAVLNQAPLGVYLVGDDFRIRYVNPTARAVFGNIPDPVGRDFEEAIHRLWPREYAAEIVARFRHTLATGESYVNPERSEQRLDRGVKECYEWRIDRVAVPEGFAVVCYFREISARVHSLGQVKALNARLAADLSAVTRLQQLSMLLVQSNELKPLLEEFTSAAIEITHADMGSVQLLQDGALKLVHHRGFPAKVIEAYEKREAGTFVCDLAREALERVVIEDVANSSQLGDAERRMILDAGARAGQATPLVSRGGRLLGMLSTFYRAPRQPDAHDLRLLDLLARPAADFIESRLNSDALRRSEERFRAFVTASSDAIYRMNADWSEMSHLRGRDFIADTEDPTRTWLEKYIHPADRTLVLESIRHAIHARSNFELEHRVLRVDGSLGWTFSRAVPIFDAAGEIVEWFGAASDITQRKQAEEALAESTKRLRIAKESASLGIYDYDPITRRINWDQRLREIWGVPPEAPITYDTFLAGLHPDDVANTDAAVARSLDRSGDGQYQAEYRVVSRVDGRLRWILAIGRGFFEQGRAVRLIGTVQDITERKRAEEALAESEKRFRFMAESMPQKITTGKPDGSVDYMNAKWIEYTGFSAEQLSGGAWMEINHPEDREENARRWRRSIETGEPYAFTHRIRRADGEYRWHLSRADPMRDGQGAIRMWIGSSTEIHEQKRIEEELRRANRDLEQFAYSASHDLQEPLRAVKIYSELLGAECAEKLDGDAAEYLGFLQNGASRMEMLVRDLLTYTRASVMDGPARPIDSAECLRAALANLAAAISESSAEISIGDLPRVPVHAAHLQQLFQNLVSNAIKYRRPGSIPEARIAAERQNQAWRFSVQDNGIGIEPEYQERIFGLFKRLHNEYPGTGIGLSLCLRILDHYHGRIWVESEPGRGSIFYFTLPA